MEILIEFIFEFFAEFIFNLEEVYDLEEKGKKWKRTIHIISIFRIILFGLGTGFLFAFGFSIGADESDMFIRVILIILGCLLTWLTIRSIKSYKKWIEKIEDVIEEKKLSFDSEDGSVFKNDYDKEFEEYNNIDNDFYQIYHSDMKEEKNEEQLSSKNL